MSYADHPHKVGPPYRAAGPTVNKTIRLSDDELGALEQHCAQHDVPLATLIRAGLKAAGLFGRRRVALDL
jgi:hypothetical protein